jgi:hypothetical protein
VFGVKSVDDLTGFNPAVCIVPACGSACKFIPDVALKEIKSMDPAPFIQFNAANNDAAVAKVLIIVFIQIVGIQKFKRGAELVHPGV